MITPNVLIKYFWPVSAPNSLPKIFELEPPLK